MEIKIEFLDLDVQGLNVQLVRETSCIHTSFSDIQKKKIEERQAKADAHFQRQLEVMKHTMDVLHRRMDAYRRNHPEL